MCYVGLSDELHKLAGEADFVVNTTPLTPATTGLFDAKFFAAMKPGAYFINVGRGKSVVQADLVAVLQDGRILTPHVSTRSDLGSEARSVIVIENLRRYVAGEKMLSVVDTGKGY